VLAKYGIPRERLALNASHTHSGPVIGRMLRPAYPLTPQHEAVIDRYTAHLQDLVVEVIGAAVGNLAPADVSFSQGLAGFAVNRRRVMLRNLAGPVDHDVPVLNLLGGMALSASSSSDTPVTTRCSPMTSSVATTPASRRRRWRRRIPARRRCSSRIAAPTPTRCRAARSN
jgi:hypothetical protein